MQLRAILKIGGYLEPEVYIFSTIKWFDTIALSLVNLTLLRTSKVLRLKHRFNCDKPFYCLIIKYIPDYNSSSLPSGKRF